MSNAIAVATCSPTRNARKNDSGLACADASESQPTRAGNSTAWPRLEIGNSSDAPCRSPIAMDWKNVTAGNAIKRPRRTAAAGGRVGYSRGSLDRAAYVARSRADPRRRLLRARGPRRVRVGRTQGLLDGVLRLALGRLRAGERRARDGDLLQLRRAPRPARD